MMMTQEANVANFMGFTTPLRGCHTIQGPTYKYILCLSYNSRGYGMQVKKLPQL